MTDRPAAVALSDVAMDQYVRDAFGDHPPSLSASVAHKLLTRSPRHAWVSHARLNAAWEPKTESRFDLGSAAHAIVLEGKRELIAALPYDDWRKKEAQQARELARLDGKIPLLADQAEAVTRMAMVVEDTIATSPDLRGLGPLVAETTLLWQDGVAWCRCRPDWMTADHAIVLSYKTTAASAEPDAFTRGVLLGSGYDLQAAFEVNAVKALAGVEPKYVWIVQEVTEPYAVSLLGLSPELAEFAQQKYRRAVARWAECMRDDEWPAYPDRICWVDPPAWAVTQWTERHGYQPPDTTLDDGRPLDEQLMGDPR